MTDKHYYIIIFFSLCGSPAKNRNQHRYFDGLIVCIGFTANCNLMDTIQ